MANKFTFKKHAKETGLRSVGHPNQNVDIKCGGKLVGIIYAPSWATKDNKWSVSFAVQDADGENCKWKWVSFKARFDDEQSAREFVNNNVEKITKLGLHCIE